MCIIIIITSTYNFLFFNMLSVSALPDPLSVFRGWFLFVIMTKVTLMVLIAILSSLLCFEIS